MFSKLRNLFRRKPRYKPSPGIAAFRERLGERLADDVLDAIESVQVGEDTEIFVEPTPGEFDAAFVHVVGPHGRRAFAIAPGVARSSIRHALVQLVEAVEATPEVLSFPEPAGAAG